MTRRKRLKAAVMIEKQDKKAFELTLYAAISPQLYLPYKLTVQREAAELTTLNITDH